jgi:HEPN domain-containing protein
METPATKEDLVESFMEVATELKSEIDELMYTQQYLEVFDGNDVYDPTRAPTLIKDIIMYLYMNNVVNKLNGWTHPHKFNDTMYTNMYHHLFKVRSRYKFIPLPSYTDTSDEDDDSGCVQRTKEEEEDWDECNPSETPERNVGVPKTSPEVASSDPAKPSQTPNKGETSTEVASPARSALVALAKQSEPTEPALLYAHLAMCEYTLIQSHDDLKCAQTLLGEGHYPQAVFMCSQSVEKSLKSLLTFFKFHFFFYMNRHSATELVSSLRRCNNDKPNTPYSKYASQFQPLCEIFESLGAESWTIEMPLSIRSRYFNFQTDWSPGSRFHYYVDSYPGVVFTKDVAKIAYAIAKEIFRMTEIIHEENIQNFNEQ